MIDVNNNFIVTNAHVLNEATHQLIIENNKGEHFKAESVYVNPDNQPVYYNYILKINPKRVILNPGTENSELEKKLAANNIPFEHACTLVLLASNQY